MDVGDELEFWYQELIPLWERLELVAASELLSTGEMRFGDIPEMAIARGRHTAQALLTESNEQKSEAAREGLRAQLRAGDLSPTWLTRAIVLAYDLGDHRLAAQLLGRLPDNAAQVLTTKQQAALTHVMGSVAEQVGAALDVEEQLRAAVALDPVTPDYHWSLVSHLLRCGKTSAARTALEEGLRRWPNDRVLRELELALGRASATDT
jgi:predicted Zn-dependent protease